ncbi:beta-galactosidase [Rossellomorea marisflavi]|uniref:beta-galactosidase n=1 Tax=Rossellomorea marisflavi TaxID=189381 RepID=UPI00351622B9
MIEIKNKQIIIDGKPELLMVGEIHYFRLARKDWQDRIDKLKDAGCNAVASYVPWVVHEQKAGEIDLDGRTRDEHDLGAYIDLCQENGLYFFVRPGPFIMAEMKNEGIPHWVYEKHPEAIPVGWDAAPAPTKTLDYLAPGFLRDVKRWYEAVMAIVKPRLHQHGGNIIGVQLDNEVGMLSWVSNTPDLTDHVIEDLWSWLGSRYDADALEERYPFNVIDKEERNRAIRSPKESYAPALMQDLGHFMRNRFARYIATLRRFAEEEGVDGIPFVVNIHGTGAGRGFTFPIGISQLYETYAEGNGYLSGSDIYFGDLDMNTFQDLYVINGMMDAVHHPDQPLTSVEFNCGDGNFGETLAGRYDPSAADLKTRMCIAQGNRLINYYLFAGGINPRMDESLNDGNDRIAFTGERHGFAAPVSPEGELNYTYLRMKRSIRTMMAVSGKVAAMDEERDDVAYGFIPDYFMTEYHYPKSDKMKEIIGNLEANRASAPWEIMTRAMLLLNYRFGAIDIQNRDIDARHTGVLALPSARYMAKEIQEKLVAYLHQGGRILLYGEVPQFDMEGNPCTVLQEALHVKEKGIRRDSQHHYLSVYHEGWAAPRPEVRTHFAQVFDYGEEKVIPLLHVYGTDELCSFEAEVGNGLAIVMATAYKCDLSFFRKAFARLGCEPSLTHDYTQHGVLLTSTGNQQGERFIHLLNLDGLDKGFHLYDGGEKLFHGKKLHLGSKEGLMLPLNLVYDDYTIVSSTAEILDVSGDALTFRLTQPADEIVLKTDKNILTSDDYTVVRKDGVTTITSLKHAKVDDHLCIAFT